MPGQSGRVGMPPFALFVGYCLVVAILLLAALVTPGGHWRVDMRLAAAAGTVAAAMILLQMVSSGRFEAISGRIGIDVTMAFHKWAAPVALLLVIGHLAFLVGLPDPERPHRIATRLSRFWSDGTLRDAWLALALLVLLVGLALLRDRLPVRYEIWRATHALGAVGLIAAVLAHVISDGTTGAVQSALWSLLALGVTAPAIWVYARRLARPARQCWRIAGNRRVADGLWEVTVEPPKGEQLGFRAGQFAWAAFGGGRLPLHDHPFSIASAPDEPGLRFLIQEAGDFTRKIGDLPLGTRVGLDAPHGSFGLRADGRGGIVLIAGGVGVAPILSILGDLDRSGCARPVRFLYAARHPGAMIPQAMFRPALDRLGVTPILLTDEGDIGEGLERGPLTEEVLKRILAGLDTATVEVLICGPGPMMTAVTDALVRLGVPLSRIEYERFSYATTDTSAKDRRMLAGFGLLFATLAAFVAIYSLV